MTKLRAPLSIDSALARIAGALPHGWREMARVVERHESTVRAWGDADRPDQIPLPAAIALDIAFQRAGGEGRPLFETYALQCEVAREAAFADEMEVARRACILVRESAQATEALIRASQAAPEAGARLEAIRELEDVVREATATITVLQQSQLAAPP
jgi:hypothetical protein